MLGCRGRGAACDVLALHQQPCRGPEMEALVTLEHCSVQALNLSVQTPWGIRMFRLPRESC